MRKTLSFVMSVLVTVFVVISCDKDNKGTGNSGNGGADYEFTLEESTVMDVNVDWRADTIVIKYSVKNPTPTGMVTPSTDVDWLTFNAQTFGEVTVYVAENQNFENRYAPFVLKYEDVAYTFTVTQNARVWDLEAICTTVFTAYNYGSATTPNTGLYYAMLLIGTGSETFLEDEHYFMFGLTFPMPEDPDDTSLPEGTYILRGEYLLDDYTMLYGNSKYNTYPGGNIFGQSYTEDTRLVVQRDGDNYIIDLDAITEQTGLSIHARYEGPIEMKKGWQ